DQPVEALRYEIGPVDHGSSNARGANVKRRRRRIVPPAAHHFRPDSGVVAEIAAERVRLLHQRLARRNLEYLPVVLFVLHVARLLAADDDDRADWWSSLRKCTSPTVDGKVSPFSYCLMTSGG